MDDHELAGNGLVGGEPSHRQLQGRERLVEPVEQRLRAHPAVADAAVVGRPDPEWGQRVVAVLELVPGAGEPSLEELRDWVRAVLPAYAAPKAVEVRPLPRTSLGKVRRTELR